MRVLMIGDIVGSPGRKILREQLPYLKRNYQPDITVVNAENAAEGRGITLAIMKELYGCGVDAITLGNHAWDRKDIFNFIDEEDRLIRPANYPQGTPGRGITRISSPNGELVLINLMGRTFLPVFLDCPFRVADQLLAKLKKQACILVDFHAEATSEKQALAWYLEGKVTAVVGTHTHVQTADERILPQGTAYISDVGMTGPYDSVLGMDKSLVIQRFCTQLPIRFEVAKGRVQLNAVVIDMDKTTGKATQIQRIRMDDDQPWRG